MSISRSKKLKISQGTKFVLVNKKMAAEGCSPDGVLSKNSEDHPIRLRPKPRLNWVIGFFQISKFLNGNCGALACFLSNVSEYQCFVFCILYILFVSFAVEVSWRKNSSACFQYFLVNQLFYHYCRNSFEKSRHQNVNNNE